MFRITHIVPTIVLTATALALAAPVAEAKPYIAPSGGTAYVSPSVQSTRVFRVYGSHLVHRDAGSGVVTTGDMPLANPVQLPAIDKSRPAPVNAPDSANGFDWTAAALGAGLASILSLMLAAGVGFRRRGQLAA
jgi:hypothetical protein